MANDDADWATDPADLLRVGADFDLASFDRGSTPGLEAGKKAGKAFRKERGDLLSEMQERLFAESRSGGGRSVLLVVQGLDTAGKGGIIRHVAGMMDPQGLAIRNFGVPTEEEREHHYLWRIRNALPKPGLIGIFDRSHYEDVLVVRVDELADVDWDERFAELIEFEKEVMAAGTAIIKVALMVSHEEQGLRLMERLDRPDKHWKYSTNDIVTRSKWDAYQAAYADMLAKTSTADAPWYVIPADRKWYARLAVT
ncbi:MAG: polyphosphate kinase 2 family protein, partial [Actinomycetes bacterium]|nr:polyphosphate kinase 2 family protein [Actinomycetes bacterium]MDX5381149.1 polyphosphate kinase 2 family protein [Actinomycetes bacterium]MDX5400405.1 polyphosphate kinase 2 family protein [Actinomycetes bacterium]MDX5450910.1 polyphosphate kinase 2 family protein [Actinomycetes bacterium]